MSHSQEISPSFAFLSIRLSVVGWWEGNPHLVRESLLSPLIPMLISSRNTFTNTPRNYVLPATWASLSSVKLKRKVNEYSDYDLSVPFQEWKENDRLNHLLKEWVQIIRGLGSTQQEATTRQCLLCRGVIIIIIKHHTFWSFVRHLYMAYGYQEDSKCRIVVEGRGKVVSFCTEDTVSTSTAISEWTKNIQYRQVVSHMSS